MSLFAGTDRAGNAADRTQRASPATQTIISIGRFAVADTRELCTTRPIAGGNWKGEIRGNGQVDR